MFFRRPNGNFSVQHTNFYLQRVPAGSPSCFGNVAVYVLDMNQPSLPTPFYFFLESVSVFMALSTISFQKFPQQLSAFSLSSSGLISALLVLSTNYWSYLFMKVPLRPDIILCGWLGLKHQLWLTGLKAPNKSLTVLALPSGNLQGFVVLMH